MEDAAEIHVEYMDTKRFREEAYLRQLQEVLLYKQSRSPYDLVITADNSTFAFLLEHGQAVFGDIPVVFCGVNYLNHGDLQGIRGITGVNEEAAVRENFRLIRKVFPDRRNLFCIVDGTPTGRIVREELTAASREFAGEFDSIEIPAELSMAGLTARLKGLDNSYTVLFTFFSRDSTGMFYEYDESARMIAGAAAEAEVPVFGTWDFSLGFGVLGGYMVSGYAQGQEAARKALRILRGTPAEEIPVTWDSPKQYMFDFPVLRRFGLRPRRMPPGSLILNEPLSLWDRYRYEITGIIIAFAALVGLIILLSINIRRRHLVESDLRDLNASLNRRVEERTRDLQSALDRLKMTQKELIRQERLAAVASLTAGVAHQINTPLGVAITGSSHLEALVRRAEDHLRSGSLTREELEEGLKNLSDGLTLIFSNMNRAADLIRRFRSLAMDEKGGVIDTFKLRKYLEEVTTSRRKEFRDRGIDLTVSGDEITMQAFPFVFYQILSNLMFNSRDHGFTGREEGRISITLTKEGGQGVLEYRDNGAGIPPDIRDQIFEPFTTTGREEGKSGLGLHLVYKIVTERLGGTIECPAVESGEGACFRIRFPLDYNRIPGGEDPGEGDSEEQE